MCGIRGGGYAVGTAYLYGRTFGATFGVLSTLGQIAGYRFGIRPGMDYRPAARPRLTRLESLAAVNRTAGYALAGYLSALTAGRRASALYLGLGAGLAIGMVTATANACTSFIEWIVDRVPARGMGVFGIGLILVGFALQSVQYWMALLDVTVK